MNIWLLTTEYPPFYGGGIGTYAKTVAEMYANHGHAVTVFVYSRESAELVINSNLKIIKFAFDKTYTYASYNECYAREVLQYLLNNKKPDVIETQDFMALGYQLIKSKLEKNKYLMDIPIIVHLHTPFFEFNRINQTVNYKPLENYMSYKEKFAIFAADGLVAPSIFMQEQINTLYPELNIKVIPLPLPVVSEQQDQLNDKSMTIGLLYIGRLEERKGIYQFIQQLARLWAEGSKIKLTLVGEDTMYTPGNYYLGEKIKNEYKPYILDGRLRMLNKLSPVELSEVVENAMVIVVPSLYENFPYVCIEAMQAGKPVLASTSGGQAELVGSDETAGWLFDWSIENDLLQKLKTIANLSEEKLIDMGANAKKRVMEICGHENNFKQRLKYFNSIINAKKNIEFYPMVNFDVLQNKKNLLGREKQNISIIIVVNDHDAENILPTLRSCLLNEFQQKEIILLNNGISDRKTLDVLIEIDNSKFPSVIIEKYVDKKNRAFIRNDYASKVDLTHICFLNAGEVVSERYFEQSFDLMANYKNIAFVVSNINSFDQNSELYCGLNPELPWLFYTNIIMPGVIYNRSILAKYGGNDERMNIDYDDYESVIKIVLSGHGGVTLTEQHINTKNNKFFSLFDKMIDPAISNLFQSILAKTPITVMKKHTADLLKVFNLVKFVKGNNQL